MEILKVTDKLVVAREAAGGWCRLSYPNHPKGCPNYGRKWCCPPKAPFILNWLGNSTEQWFVCVPFNLEEHADTMKQRHPNWTDRQCRNLLYWQPRVNKELQGETYLFSKRFGAYCVLNGVTYTPEAMGVNVIETARRQGLPIEMRPQKIVYKIALVANKKEG